MRNYKKIDSTWTNTIPMEWDKIRLKYISDFKNGYAFNSDNFVEDGIPVVRIGDITNLDDISNAKKIALEEAEQLQDFFIRKYDILIALTGATIGKSAINISEERMLLNQRVGVIRSNKININYLYYFISSDIFKEYVRLESSGGAQENIGKKEIGNIDIFLPKVEELMKIVKFLDKEVSRISSLIISKEKLINLLEQQRQSIITEAVTKGLNPNVKMKDSGVEWIGEIPEHWKLKRLKNGVFLNPSKNEVSDVRDREVTFLPMENILAPNKVDISIKKKIEEVYNGYTYFKEEDLVLAKVTPCFENGNIAVMQNIENGIGFGTTELHVLRSKKQQNIYFYFYLAQSAPFKQQGVSTMYGVGGLKRIPNEFILNYKFGMPPLKEQNEIADFLNLKCKEIENTKQLIKQQIEKLKEYRQSLIYEAVTGKIDVRDMELD